MWGIFFALSEGSLRKHPNAIARDQAAEVERERHRRIASDCSALVALLKELYPPTMPNLNASEREIGAYIGERRLIERLEKLIQEAREAPPGELPQVIGG